MQKDEPRNIDLSGCEVIGRGQCGEIYQYGKDRVVKLFFDTIPRESILKEYEQTCEGHRMDIHAVECYGLVSCDGKIGIEMERVKGDNLEKTMMEDRAHPAVYGAKMADELKLIHSRAANREMFPPIHEFYLDCLEKCRRDEWVTAEEEKKIEAFIRAIPVCTTMVHGDYHILNVMWEKDEIRLIDLADCMDGHPVYDLLISNLYMHFMPTRLKDTFGVLIHISPEEMLSFWDRFIRTYFETEDEERISEINEILDVYSMLKVILAPHSFSNMAKEFHAKYVGLGRQYLMPDIEKYTGRIPERILDLGKKNHG